MQNNELVKNISEILFSLILAVAAAWLGKLFPIIGGSVFGIILGIFINNILRKPGNVLKGTGFACKK